MKNISIVILMSLVLMSCASNTRNSDGALGYQGRSGNAFGYGSVLKALEALKKRSDAEVRVERGWTVIRIDSERSIWSFPPETHKAYPSAVKREVIEKDGTLYLDTKVSCGASKDVCDELVIDFINLNKKVYDTF